MKPTFKAQFLPDGTTALQCKQTGAHYIIAKADREFASYRDGQLLRVGERAMVVDAVENDARWELRR